VRIVSLCPSLTELVYDLERGDELVGITSYCIHPADRVGAVEKVGGTKDPDIARIVELAPDIVLLNEEENRVEDATALVDAGLTCHTSMPRTVDATAAMVRSIATALDASKPGEAIAADIEQRRERIEHAARSLQPVRYAYLIWRKPWMAAGIDTYVHALLSTAGGINVFGEDAGRYPEVELSKFADMKPGIVLLSSEPFPFEAKHIQELAEATGLSPERFLLVDGELLSWHGSKTPAGLDYAEESLNTARARIASK